MNRQPFDENLHKFKLVPFSKEYRLMDFDCGIEEYNEFLTEDAEMLEKTNITKTHLMISKNNADIVSFISFIVASIKLNNSEKVKHDIDLVFDSYPAIKIVKLAVDKNYTEKYKNIGKSMLVLARGAANEMLKCGIGCRFIVVDADIKSNETVNKFYEKCGFVYNEKYTSKKDFRSMRFDLNK